MADLIHLADRFEDAVNALDRIADSLARIADAQEAQALAAFPDFVPERHRR